MTSLQTERTEAPIDDVPSEELLEWLHEMILIRRFEEAGEELSLRGRIPGGIHPAIGQEAVAVGVTRALRPDDVVTSTHRSHHHALAKGLSPDAVMAELYGKETGVVGGRGGSMHLADFDQGLWGSNGIVGGGLGIAMGSALGAKQLGTDRVSVGFFGDGGANTGRVWEFVNLASVWKLPLIAICENNLYAVETPSASVTGGANVAHRARGFGLPAKQVDGQSVVAVYNAASEAVRAARSGAGAQFLELLTYRYKGHNAGEVITYRTEEETQHWRSSKDPIDRFTYFLTQRGILSDEVLADINASVEETVTHSIEFAEASTYADPSTAGENVSSWNDENRSH
ncbi:thiamine pyrophosphate-dependent dehydrogenase E1 component subunit alpha [Microbacterium sp. 179-I 3D3 NHS]|uniref:thiamine pyrophosphate-dependent dehydrogenase E1 component subunit alpha n=1 Tax=unclassified Microbacterium TaxID=2609290 RepID=UPI0039A14C45